MRDWQAANGFRVQLPIVAWTAKEGYTGASLHAVVVHDGTQVRHLVLKCVPPGPDGTFGVAAGREPARHRKAYAYNDEFSRRHLVTQPFPALLTPARQVLMFQSFASFSQLPKRFWPTAGGTQLTVSFCATSWSRMSLTRTYQASNGSYCREYQQEITIDGKPQRSYGTACRQPDGSWKVVNG